jgi:hypothetical protein
MKKMIMSLAIGVLSIAGFQALATDGETGASRQHQQQPRECPSDTCRAPRGPEMGGPQCQQQPAPRKCPFEGISLSDSQKADLKSLHETAQKAMMEAKGDSAQMAQAKTDFLAGVKKTLGDKKYVQFLENSFSFEQPQPQQPGREPQDKRRGPKGDRKPMARPEGAPAPSEAAPATSL